MASSGILMLQRPTQGCRIRKLPVNRQLFGIPDALNAVWVACHFQRKLGKKDVETADIEAAAAHILNYSRTSGVSLRVSGGLLLGVAHIYWRKIDYFWAQCQHVLERMKKPQTTRNRDPRPRSSPIKATENRVALAANNECYPWTDDDEEVEKAIYERFLNFENASHETQNAHAPTIRRRRGMLTAQSLADLFGPPAQPLALANIAEGVNEDSPGNTSADDPDTVNEQTLQKWFAPSTPNDEVALLAELGIRLVPDPDGDTERDSATADGEREEGYERVDRVPTILNGTEDRLENRSLEGAAEKPLSEAPLSDNMSSAAPSVDAVLRREVAEMSPTQLVNVMTAHRDLSKDDSVARAFDSPVVATPLVNVDSPVSQADSAAWRSTDDRALSPHFGMSEHDRTSSNQRRMSLLSLENEFLLPPSGGSYSESAADMAAEDSVEGEAPPRQLAHSTISVMSDAEVRAVQTDTTSLILPLIRRQTPVLANVRLCGVMGRRRVFTLQQHPQPNAVTEALHALRSRLHEEQQNAAAPIASETSKKRKRPAEAAVSPRSATADFKVALEIAQTLLLPSFSSYQALVEQRMHAPAPLLGRLGATLCEEQRRMEEKATAAALLWRMAEEDQSRTLAVRRRQTAKSTTTTALRRRRQSEPDAANGDDNGIGEAVSVDVLLDTDEEGEHMVDTAKEPPEDANVSGRRASSEAEGPVSSAGALVPLHVWSCGEAASSDAHVSSSSSSATPPSTERLTSSGPLASSEKKLLPAAPDSPKLVPFDGPGAFLDYTQDDDADARELQAIIRGRPDEAAAPLQQQLPEDETSAFTRRTPFKTPLRNIDFDDDGLGNASVSLMLDNYGVPSSACGSRTPMSRHIAVQEVTPIRGFSVTPSTKDRELHVRAPLINGRVRQVLPLGVLLEKSSTQGWNMLKKEAEFSRRTVRILECLSARMARPDAPVIPEKDFDEDFKPAAAASRPVSASTAATDCDNDEPLVPVVSFMNMTVSQPPDVVAGLFFELLTLRSRRFIRFQTNLLDDDSKTFFADDNGGTPIIGIGGADLLIATDTRYDRLANELCEATFLMG